jgi:hypothetical protein
MNKDEIEKIEQEDKICYKNFSSGIVDEHGKAIVVVHIDGDPSLAYAHYSNRFNLKISPMLYDHIIDESDSTNRPVHIKVYNDILIQNNTRRDLLKISMQNTFTSKRMEIIDEIKSCTRFGILFWMICIAITFGAFLLPHENYFSEVTSQLLFIVGWVFGWAGTEKLLMERLQLRKKYKSVLKLACAEISFEKLPPPLLPKPDMS